MNVSEKLNAQQIIEFISNAKKVTPVKVYVKGDNVASLSYGEGSNNIYTDIKAEDDKYLYYKLILEES